MTDQELIARLRDDSGDWLTDASADRIEELAAHAETMAQIVEAYREHAKRLEEAMRKAILLAEQPHYGDRGDALDHCFDGIDVLRDALKGTDHEQRIGT